MLVNKPQFDIDNIKVGSAYWLKKKSRGYVEINTPCIIREITPLYAVVYFYNDKAKQMDSTKINIENIVDKTMELEFMIIERGAKIDS